MSLRLSFLCALLLSLFLFAGFLLYSLDFFDDEAAAKQAIPISFASSDQIGIIKLQPDMFVNESIAGETSLLIDEQQLVGDPGQTKAKPKNAFFTRHHSKWLYPVSFTVDLKAIHAISEIYLYAVNLSSVVKIEGGKPFSWKPLTEEAPAIDKSWRKYTVYADTRYLRFTVEQSINPVELVIKGKPLETVKVATTPANTKRPRQVTMDQLIGVNAFIDDPLDKLNAVGFVREYHNWRWDESQTKTYPNNEKKWNPSYAGGGWNFDDFYRQLKDQDILVAPAMMGTVKWISPDGNKPVPEGKSSEDPASYIAHADHMYQFVARYGSGDVRKAPLKLAPDQDKKAALGLLHYYENWNEQNMDWMGRTHHFTPFEYAAMASADYDGHQGKLGKTVGVKNADPNARMVMGGLAGINLDYIKAIKHWADYNRNGSVPFDVINVHHYSRADKKDGRVGISPEEDNLKERLQELVAYRDAAMPGKEVWITEFGYDTHPRSPQRAPAIASFSQEEVQGQWLVRSYLAIAAAGVDRAAMYMLRDVNPDADVQYCTSGLTSSKETGWKLKPSWYYVYTLKNRLKGMHFTGGAEKAGAMVYTFRNNETGQGAYVVWSPTSTGATIKDYELTIPKNNTSVKKVALANGQQNGIETPLKLTGQQVKFDVTESPVFVLLDKM
ncbi:glycoside hydrolase family protein [Pontibacter akesuensis]|nr:hypothetical protein [Pontibacter akesuensis]GHA56688.1 hypothetical protein GCM10007389_05410 [Pontibacter akesuensis]